MTDFEKENDVKDIFYWKIGGSNMTIYVLKRNIDGYGGHMKDEYFISYESAKEHLAKTSGLWFHDGKWDVEGIKECSWSEDKNSLKLIGIQYPKENKDEWSIDWCRCSIEPVIIPFELVNNELFLLQYITGYNHWLYNFIDGNGDSDKVSTLKYCRSIKSARKIAARNKAYKHTARLWVRPEEEKRISPITGGENYLSISKVVCI